MEKFLKIVGKLNLSREVRMERAGICSFVIDGKNYNWFLWLLLLILFACF